MLRDALVVILPVVAAVIAAQQLSLHDQRTRAALLTDVVLDRAARASAQIYATYEQMRQFTPADACSAAAITRMRQLDLGSTLLQGVGYVEGNTLKCSSLDDAETIDVGAPDYISATDNAFRRNRRLAIAPDTPLLLVTGPTGFTAILHPGLIFSLTGDTEDLPAGVVGFSQRQALAESHPGAVDWNSIAMGEPGSAGTFVRGDQLIAWRRSAKWDHFSYAAIPMTAVDAGFAELARWFVPAGLLIGVLALVLVRRLVASRASLPALLRTGLRRGEIFVVYQPIVDMADGRWVGAEVLARWRRPGGEMISPDVFVPIAEKHGLIGRLTQQVTEMALGDFSEFIAARPEFFLSLNISSFDLSEPEFPAFMMDACRRRGVPPAAVHLEITEREEVDPLGEAEAIRTLRGHRFSVGIDDFGMGYSNLAYLDTLQLDYLKIDRAFVAAAASGELGGEIVDHIVGLARSRQLEVIAEGVEREEQRIQLMARGVSMAQGWLFGKPMARSEFISGHAQQQAARPVTLARVA